MIENIIVDYNSDDFFLSSYKAHLDLFHSRSSQYGKEASYSRQQLNYYAAQCIDRGLITREDAEMDLLPRVCFKTLFNQISNIGSDGEE